MTPQQTRTATHFATLFAAALGGWLAFHLADAGEAHLFAGVIVAGLLAYGGTLVAAHATARDLRRTYRPNAHVLPERPVSASFPAVATPRGGRLVAFPAARRYDLDVAAGD